MNRLKNNYMKSYHNFYNIYLNNILAKNEIYILKNKKLSK